MAKRLTEKHPLDIKWRKVEALMLELGVTVDFNNCQTTVTDTQTGVSAELLDSDSGSQVTYLPYQFENKLVIHD